MLFLLASGKVPSEQLCLCAAQFSHPPDLPAGKSFFKKKKQPVPVRLTGKDWAAQIRKACEATYLFWSGELGVPSALCIVEFYDAICLLHSTDTV